MSQHLSFLVRAVRLEHRRGYPSHSPAQPSTAEADAIDTLEPSWSLPMSSSSSSSESKAERSTHTRSCRGIGGPPCPLARATAFAMFGAGIIARTDSPVDRKSLRHASPSSALYIAAPLMMAARKVCLMLSTALASLFSPDLPLSERSRVSSGRDFCRSRADNARDFGRLQPMGGSCLFHHKDTGR